jgi:hypothetical protein
VSGLFVALTGTFLAELVHDSSPGRDRGGLARFGPGESRQAERLRASRWIGVMSDVGVSPGFGGAWKTEHPRSELVVVSVGCGQGVHQHLALMS